MLNLKVQESYCYINTLKNKVILGLFARIRETIGTIFEKSREDFKKIISQPPSRMDLSYIRSGWPAVQQIIYGQDPLFFLC